MASVLILVVIKASWITYLENKGSSCTAVSDRKVQAECRVAERSEDPGQDMPD